MEHSGFIFQQHELDIVMHVLGEILFLIHIPLCGQFTQYSAGENASVILRKFMLVLK